MAPISTIFIIMLAFALVFSINSVNYGKKNVHNSKLRKLSVASADSRISCAQKCASSEQCSGFTFSPGQCTPGQCTMMLHDDYGSDDHQTADPDNSQEIWSERSLHGALSTWTSWASCICVSGFSTRKRTRACDMTVHGSKTKPCIGELMQSEECPNSPCPSATCTSLKREGETQNGLYRIKPDPSSAAFLAFCDFDKLAEGITVIGHDHEAKTLVNGFEDDGSYRIVLTYNASSAQIDALAAASTNCRQFLRWDCKSASIYNPSDRSGHPTYWETKSGSISDYFAGCGCTDVARCGADNTGGCECDRIESFDIWAFDEGYLITKGDLPISAFAAGDTGGWAEDAFHTIGPLECYGGI